MRRQGDPPRSAGPTVGLTIALVGSLVLATAALRWEGDDIVPPGIATDAAARGPFTDTVGKFEFVPSSGPDPDRAITVAYRAPSGSPAGHPVLVVIPGRGRNAIDYRNDWLDQADEHDALLLVPEFPADRYPLAAYNLGNLVDVSQWM